MSITESLRDQLRTLAALRHAVSLELQAIQREKRALADRMATQLMQHEATKRELEATEASVRGMALVAHETTGETKPVDGVSIVMRKSYNVDEGKALVWARATGMCLIPESVDMKALQKIAAATPLPFVKVDTTPSAQIAGDLSVFFAQADYVIVDERGDVELPWEEVT